MNLAKSLETNALRRPNHPAIIEKTGVTSHREFNDMVKKRAALLCQLGAKTGKIVGVNLQDTAEHLAVLFALARIGVAALPMDWRWTDSEKSSLTAFFKPCIVISDPADSFGEIKGTWKSVKADDNWLSSVNSANPKAAPLATGDPPLLLALSSGTTGIPKGPLISHKQFFARFLIYFSTLGFSERTRYLCATPLYFGGSRGYSMCSIFSGGTTILYPPPYEMSDLVEFSERQRATKLFLVPTLLRRLMELPPRPDGKPIMKTLNLLFSTGSILHPEERSTLMRTIAPNYLNFYGSTDGGGATALFWDDPPDVSSSVGQPVFGAVVEITDKNDKPVKSGEIGQIRYKHPGTATGYFNDPIQSGEAFRNGWYYPGDLGWKDKNGYLYLAGRAKDIIIRGGVNIYPAEIEHTLTRHKAIRDAAVVSWPSPKFGEEIAAFVVRNELETNESDLLNWCSAHLAPYKIPRKIFTLKDLPKSNVGKVLKAELSKRLPLIK